MKEQGHVIELCANHIPGSILKPCTEWLPAHHSPYLGLEQRALNATPAAENSLKHTSRLLNQTLARPSSSVLNTDDKKDLVSSTPSKAQRF